MSKSVKNSLTLFLLIIGINSCALNSYVEYKPHYLSKNSERKYYGQPVLDSIQFANTLQVLKYYKEDYKTKNGTVILVTKELAEDWSLLWNYTTKANNSEWLKTHKPK